MMAAFLVGFLKHVLYFALCILSAVLAGFIVWAIEKIKKGYR